uniref:SH2 domain-containing protein n=1 Tax=Monopterus albus TaxID=43700 RepID=A0A3Q3IU25_MONAL
LTLSHTHGNVVLQTVRVAASQTSGSLLYGSWGHKCHIGESLKVLFCFLEPNLFTINVFQNSSSWFELPKRFKTLPELVSLYLQPNQGLVTTLLYPVEREETAVSDDRDYSGI